MLDSEIISSEQIKHNQSLWKWFPLGQIDAMWNMIEHLADQVGRKKYTKEIEELFGALQTLDDKVRRDNYPMKKKVKRKS